VLASPGSASVAPSAGRLLSLLFGRQVEDLGEPPSTAPGRSEAVDEPGGVDAYTTTPAGIKGPGGRMPSPPYA
jgi:hypothetical protein